MVEKDITFLMVGCSRCGTTWVDKALREHPDVYLPPNKQTYFFDSHYDKGIEWYLQHFEVDGKQCNAIGEIATYYSQPDLVPLVAKHFPQAKLLMSVRNPVERAYSFYQSRASRFNWKTLEQAIKEQPNDLIERGKYDEQADAILAHYPKEQLKIVFFDDLKEHPENFLKEILGYIGVDDTFKSSLIGQMVQVTIDPRIRRTLKKMGLMPLMNFISKRPIGDKLRAMLRKSNVPRYKPINPAEKKLLLDIYLPHIEKLEQITGRNLTSWKR